MESSQFETLMLAITGLKTELKSDISRLEAKLEAKMDSGFAAIRRDLEIVKAQTAKTYEITANHEGRIKKLEGPNA